MSTVFAKAHDGRYHHITRTLPNVDRRMSQNASPSQTLHDICQSFVPVAEISAWSTSAPPVTNWRACQAAATPPPNRPHIVSRSPPHRPRIEPRSTPYRPQVDDRATPDRYPRSPSSPRIDPRWTPARPRIHPRSTPAKSANVDLILFQIRPDVDQQFAHRSRLQRRRHGVTGHCGAAPAAATGAGAARVRGGPHRRFSAARPSRDSGARGGGQLWGGGLGGVLLGSVAQDLGDSGRDRPFQAIFRRGLWLGRRPEISWVPLGSAPRIL